ncbi:MAG TPA: prepilin-type N-terminal cleavage/methylation domain-containing protein [Gemmatimonadales bacterium]|jgi:prepilin-type N-terminal cleavage/methylation domain-containing protein
MNTRVSLNNERGFQLIELFTALVIIGVLAAYGYPKLALALKKGNVRAAVSAVIGMHARTRAVAVARGKAAKLVLTSGNLKIITVNPVTAATLVLTTQNIASQYGVTITPSRDTLKFDPRGLGTEGGATTVIVSNSALTDTVNITAIGRINH